MPPIKRKLALAANAERDLAAIYDYTADRWGKSHAASYLRSIWEAFELLRENPSLGRRRDDVPFPYLTYAVQRHYIIFRATDDQLRVLHLLHGAMDFEARLSSISVQEPKQ